MCVFIIVTPQNFESNFILYIYERTSIIYNFILNEYSYTIQYKYKIFDIIFDYICTNNIRNVCASEVIKNYIINIYSIVIC